MENLINLAYTQKLKKEFQTLANWANIVAIIGFINAGLSLIAAARLGNIGSALISVAISVALNIYLLKFAKSMKAGLETSNQNETNEGLNNLKTYFLVYGIILIIAIAVIALVLTFAFGYVMDIISRGRF